MGKPLTINNIGEKVKELRVAKGISQQQLADQLGMTRSAVGQIEIGKANPSIDTLYQLVRVFNKSYEYFIEGVETDKNAHTDVYPNVYPNAYPIDDLTSLTELNAQDFVVQEPEGVYQHRRIESAKKWEPATVVIDRKNRLQVSLIEARAAAGYARTMGSAEFLGDMPVFSLPFPAFEQETHICIQIEGSSMESRILHMDYVIASQVLTSARLRPGEVYILVTSEGIQAKRLRSVPKPGAEWHFTSDNPAYGDLLIHPDEIHQLWLGRWVLTNHMGRISGPATVEDLAARLTRLENRLNSDSIAE